MRLQRQVYVILGSGGSNIFAEYYTRGGQVSQKTSLMVEIRS